MMAPVQQLQSVKLVLCSLVATLLFAGPVLLSRAPDGEGAVWARDLSKLRDAGGSGRKARPKQSASKIDRKPRASSADKGSMKRAAAERPRLPSTRKSRDVAKRPTKAQRPSSASGSSRTRPFARDTAGKPKQNVASAGRQASKEDLKSKATSRQQQKTELREERNAKVKEGRKQYAENKEDIRSDRKQALEELQQNKFDQQNDNREDWQDYMDEAREDREDLWEDIYDDRRYWGNDRYYHYDDDDDNGWLWGIAGAVVGGVAGYAIGASVSEPPEGTVTVPVNGQPYQYYGGAFYEPAPSGTGYVTTTAPVGAEVEAPPIDCTIVFGPKDEGYCYFQGAFFIYDESSDQYVVVEPPAGTSVTYLPPGYEEVTVGDSTYMKLGGTYYRPYYEGDDVVYVVSEV